MADTYGVTHADVSAEIPGLFPTGFSAQTKPTDAQVTALISTADTVASLRVLDIAGVAPNVSDKASVLAKRYIIDWTKAQVLQIVYTGNDPATVASAVDPYKASAKSLLEELETLGEQAAGAGDAAPRFSSNTNPSDRELLVTDVMIDAGPDRVRMF